MSNWTSESILALAPDSGSAKSGRELANPHKWVSLGHSETALWGECQGSGKNPYKTQIDLGEPAFKCSCPSRKFPCKHGLGLFLLYAEKLDAFSQTEIPAWVKDWLESRNKRAETKAAKATEPEKPVDEAAQAKRTEAREKKVKAGLEALSLWLKDLLRDGIAQAQSKPHSFWESQAARLVDAQAPGLARMVRELAEIPASGADWPSRLLEKMGLIHLLIEGYSRQDSLSEATRADVRNYVGWNLDQAEILARSGVADTWNVLGQYLETQDRLRIRRTWLMGDSGKPALILDFAHGSQPFDSTLAVGTRFTGELAFYPSGFPLRALIRSRDSKTEMLESPPTHPNLEAALSSYGKALSCQPWLERLPLSLGNTIPQQTETGWILRDSENRVIPVSRQSNQMWKILALSGGNLITLFGEWDGQSFLPLTAWAEGQMYVLEVNA